MPVRKRQAASSVVPPDSALASDPAARGLADDAAVLPLGDERLILTKDMMVEGVHWFGADAAVPSDPADVAWKLLSVNLSDLAAKGAAPLGVLLGFTLGDADWDHRFAEGLGAALAVYDVPLLGGDTVSASGARTLSLTALGRATCYPVPGRDGAEAGDGLWLCGAVGDAYAGYSLSQNGTEIGDAALLSAFHRPRALLMEGRALAPHVHAMMDVSDGLLLDAARMARASGLSVAIDGDAVPRSAAFQSWAGDDPSRWAQAIRFGDDYALLFAAPPGFAPPVPATCIGCFLDDARSHLILDGAPLSMYDHGGWLHN